MTRVKALTDRTIAERFTEVKDEQSLWGEIGEQTALLAKRLLESALEAELTHRLLAARYRRTEVRRGWRNGGYGRQIISCWGVLDIRLPRARQQLPPSQVLGRFQRRQPEVDQLLRQAFLRGVSTREVGEVLEPLLADRPSAQTVSRVAQALDAEVKRFHWRRLDDDVSYLLLDGISMKVKHPGGVSQKLVLVAYGIRRDGSRVLLDFRLATASSAQWEAFLENLFRRGLEGQRLALVVTDGCPGLQAALEMVYPRVARQHCWVHKLRNVAAKLPRKHQQACLRGARRVYAAKHARQASERFRRWAQEWRSVAPKAVRCLEQDLEQLLAFYDCPTQLWTKIRTTNAIERSFREVRRRTRPMSLLSKQRQLRKDYLLRRRQAKPTLPAPEPSPSRCFYTSFLTLPNGTHPTFWLQALRHASVRRFSDGRLWLGATPDAARDTQTTRTADDASAAADPRGSPDD